MKFGVEINEKDLIEMIVERVADKLVEDYKSSSWSFYGDRDANKIFEEKAKALLKKDPALGKKVDKFLKSKLNDKKLIASVAKKIIEEKLEEDKY